MKTPNLNTQSDQIIFLCKFGSHLYGTNTENSDTDWKGVFIQDPKEVLLGVKRENVQKNTNGSNSKNKPEDVDTEFIELRKFLKDCASGQTYALDMLFCETPEVTTSAWEEIKRNRDKLISKNIAPYIGYCRKQAGKYGLKGSRLGALLDLISSIEGMARGKKFLHEITEDIVENEHVKKITYTPKSGTASQFIEVLGRKYDYKVNISSVLDSLYKMREKYGDRAELAKNNQGVDWKAISHAFRICYQLIEIAETGKVGFPLAQADFLKTIKCGKIDYCNLQEQLAALMEEAIQKIETSNLPSEPDEEWMRDFILNQYRNLILFYYEREKF